MVVLKTRDEIEKMKRANTIVSEVLAELAPK